MLTDSELLRQHVEDGSEAAFTELVHRYARLVYSAAWRAVGGKGHLAEDVTQDVFILLARKAPRLMGHETLAGWLHTTTRYVAFRMIRNLRKRATLEQEAATMQTNSAPEVPWEQLCPWLDEAVGRLDDRDRDAVLLRYVQGHSHREVGAALGLSEDSARMRTDRAVEKLRRHFARGGVVTTEALLAEALSANLAQATPPGLIDKVAAVAHAKGPSLGQVFFKALYMTTNTKLILTAAILGAAFAVGWSSSDFVAAPVLPSVKKVVVKEVPPSPADALAQAEADLAKLLRIPSAYNRERLEMDYIEKLNISVTQALLAEFTTKPLTESTKELVPLLAYHWAELDPDAAWAWVQTVQNKDVQNLCAGNILDAYSGKNAPAAFSALAKLPANLSFSFLALIVMNNYAEQDPRAALAALQNASDDPKFASLSGAEIFEHWTEEDPAAAAAAVVSQPAGFMLTSAMRMVADTWAKQDPTAALAWANTLPEDRSQVVAINTILNDYSVEDPAAAANYYLANRDYLSSAFLSQSLPTIVQNWAAADPSALLTWANQNLTGQPYNNAAIQALRQLGNSDPAAAAAYLTQNPDPSVLAQATPALGAAWGQQDPPAALAWAQSLPSDNVSLRNSAISQTVIGWAAIDPVAAASYIQQNLATDSDLGNVAPRLATAWGATNPQAALQWAKSLPPDVQAPVSIAAVTQLAKADPQAGGKAAQEALGSLPNLTQGQQTALQKIIDAAASH